MRIERWLGLGMAAVAVIATAAPSRVRAQDWLSDRSRTEGPGFRLGDFELHPGIGVEIGYDSNLYFSSGAPPTPVVDTGILRATAHLLFSTRGEQRRQEGESGGGESGGDSGLPAVIFRGGLSGSFYTFFSDLDRTNMEANASLALTILPRRPFSIDITEDFGRSIRPFTENTSATASFARDRNDLGVRFNFATSGEVLKISAGYNFRLDFFEDQLFQYGNRFQHRVSLIETFRFLPQTAIVHDTTFSVVDYFGDQSMAPVLVNNGYLLRTRLGLNGALTTNFSVLATVGYAAGFYDSPVASTYNQDYESVVAQVEARWQIEENTRLVFGYDRDFQPSFIGNWFRQDRGYANFQWLFGGAFLLGVEASLGYYEFGRIVQADGTTAAGNTLTREDIRFIGSLFAEYRFTDWLGVNATVSYTGGFTDYQYRVEAPGTGPFLDPANFDKFQAWGGVRVFY